MENRPPQESAAQEAAELATYEKNWKEQRKKLQEWKWTQIEIDGYKDFSFMLIVGWTIQLGLFCMPFVDTILDGILIHQMVDERESLQSASSVNETQGFCDHNATSTRIVFNARDKTVLPCDTVIKGLLAMILFYAFFSLINFLFTVYDLLRGYKIVKSRDVSDSFIDATAYNLHSVFWYSHFCFFKAVSQNEEPGDYAVLFVYQTIRAGKQLICDVPHFILALMNSFLINQLNTNNITERSTATTVLKLLLLAVRLLALLSCLIAYLPIRLCFVHGRLQIYTSFRIEKRIDLTLWGQKHKFSQMQSNGDVQMVQTTATFSSSPNSPPPSSDPNSNSPPPSNPPPSNPSSPYPPSDPSTIGVSYDPSANPSYPPYAGQDYYPPQDAQVQQGYPAYPTLNAQQQQYYQDQPAGYQPQQQYY